MSFLHVYHEADGDQPLLSTRDDERIKLELGANQVLFQSYSLPPLRDTASADEVFDEHATLIDELRARSGCQQVELRGMSPVYPDGKLRRELLYSESRSVGQQWHLFLHGQAIFYLHLAHRVYVIGCERGNLVSIPADMPHWFDMGPQPDFVTLTLSEDAAHSLAETTSDIALRFPRYESLINHAA